MTVRDVNLKFNTTKGYIAVFGGAVFIVLFLSLILGLREALPIGFFLLLFLMLAGEWLAIRIARHIEGDLLIAFPKMYGDLFTHHPVQINYQLDLDGYLTAICYDGTFLYIIEKNRMVTLKWSDVRQWEWAIITPQKQITTGNTPGTAFQGFVNDSFANVAPTVKAIKNSGIRLTIKNLNHPQWFYNTGRKKDAEAVCRRWEEIFHQFDDGTLTIAR
jgi:signal transduction histidine kinase